MGFKHKTEEEYIHEIETLKAEVASLKETIANLIAMVGQNSRNSSKPPSSDGYAKPSPKSLREKSGKKPGAQNGHKGNGFKIVREPDETKEHKPCQCAGCPFDGECTGRVSDTRYEVDIVISTRIVAHKALAFDCPLNSGEGIKGSFPAGINSTVQYGDNVAALAVALNTNGMMGVNRVHETINGVFGVPISVGTVAAMVSRCAKQVEPAVECIKEGITSAPLGHFDETGIRVEGSLHWLHSASDRLLTFLSVERKRGKEGMDAAGVLPEFTGIAIHDCWQPYFKYEGMAHGLCGAHFLRELANAHENTGQQWASNMAELLLEMLESKEELIRRGETRFSETQWAFLSGTYDALVAEAIETNPIAEKPKGKRGRPRRGKVRALADRLARYKGEVCLFATDFSVPFTNNQGERDLRMAKVKQKVAGSFRKLKGAKDFAAIMSYTSTCRKHGISAFEAIKHALCGNAFIFGSDATE